VAGTGLAFLAGVLSTLSPCVLPLVPIVLATAFSRNRYGPAALAAGVAVSFVTIGLFVATAGFALGLGEDVFRSAAAIVLIVVGGILLLPRLQFQLAAAAGLVGNWAQARAGGIAGDSLAGQFAVGVLLGIVWSPCVGPTLGAASVLAARAQNLPQVALIMAAFGLGAALPLLAIGVISREALARWRGHLLAVGTFGKLIVGAAFVVLGVLILSGLDRRIETALVDASPDWLTALTTRF
jgi:cytochrome c-type biogenesis protein